MWLHRIQARLNALRLRLRFLVQKERIDAEMEEELRFHLQMEIEAKMATGLPAAEARRQAFLRFGGVERIKEQVRESRGIRPLEELARDLGYTLRQMARAPLLTATAVTTLALGIGANTAVFSVVNGLLLRDRPYQAPEELVHVYSSVEGETLYATSYARDLEDLRALKDVFLDVGAFSGVPSRIAEAHGARMVLVEGVTANLFPLVGIEPQLGRGFTPGEDEAEGAQPVAVLGDRLWRTRYGRDPDVLGETVRLGGMVFTIIGVAPERFESFTAQGFQTEIFVPMSRAGALLDAPGSDAAPTVRGRQGSKIIARLRPGVGLEQARARVQGLAMALKLAHPDLYGHRSFHLHPSRDIALQPDLDAAFMTGATLLLAAVGMVLLLTCLNLASFLLARGMDRGREMAMRLALGARRAHLIRQLLTETLTLGFLGAALGVLLSGWTLDLISSSVPPTALPLSIDTGMDGRLLLFTVTLATLAGLLAGLAPALHCTGPDLTRALKSGTRTGGNPRRRLQQGLVALQMSASMVLLVAGGLFVRSMTAAQSVDPGFDTRPAALLWVDLGVSGIEREAWPQVAETLKEQALALPGVARVSLSNGVQLSESVSQMDFVIPGSEPPAGRELHRAYSLAVDADYLSTMGIPLLAGRGIGYEDQVTAEPVVVASEAAARRYWPDGNALGAEVRPDGSGESYRVVGVARDTKVATLRAGPEPLFYFPRSQLQRRAGQLWLVARGTGSAAETVEALRALARRLDPDLVVVQAKTLEEQMRFSLFLPRLGGFVFGFFGLLALAVASVGLFGVVGHSVARRTREVGIRMSLGADKGAVVRWVGREALGVVAVGGFLGLAAAMVLMRFAGGYLTGVTAYDPTTLVCVPLLLFGVAGVAALVPALRASRVNPVQALKAD